MQTTINRILAPFKAKGIDAGARQTPHGWFIWIGEWSGTHKDGSQYAETLARKVREEMMEAASCRNVAQSSGSCQAA